MKRTFQTSRLAIALPLTIVAGCASVPQQDVIDYTVSEAEYLAVMNPQSTSPAKTQSFVAAPSDRTSTKQLAAVQPMPAIKKGISSVTATEAAAESQIQEPELATAIDKKTYLNSLKFGPSVYASAGLGIARLNPDTSQAPEYSLDDGIAGAGQATIGVDIAKRLSVELHTADYGSAGLSPEGRVNYHMNGISALIYGGKNVDRHERRGWNGFARIGYNQVKNTPVGNVPFIEQTSNHASVGVGAEYNTRHGLGVRADLVAFDGNVQFGQLGLLYRMGKNSMPMLAQVTPEAAPQTAIAQAQTPKALTEPLMAAAVPLGQQPEPKLEYEQDFTFTNVIDQPASSPCDGISGTLNDINFLAGTAHLVIDAQNALNEIAYTLNECAERNVVISAHTDNAGSAISNHVLSKSRARTVATYLARRGVEMSRLRAVAFGEARPVASNATLDGRRLNRRVELEVR